MKTIIILLLAITLISCKTGPEGEGRVITNDNYVIVTIDGCEYIEFDHGVLDQSVYSLTHKGNCKNHSK